jgi:hypothetical protein
LWDGGFESSVTGGGFSWLLPEGFRGVQVGIDTQLKHSGNRSLRLIFEGKSNINFAGVCHYVPVQPSTAYRFSAWVKTRALTTDQGIRFQLHPLGTKCPGPQGRMFRNCKFAWSVFPARKRRTRFRGQLGWMTLHWFPNPRSIPNHEVAPPRNLRAGRVWRCRARRRRRLGSSRP